jgi:hypothetical protein
MISPLLRHQSVEALVIEPRKACLQAFAVQQCADAPIAVHRPLIHQAPHRYVRFKWGPLHVESNVRYATQGVWQIFLRSSAMK